MGSQSTGPDSQVGCCRYRAPRGAPTQRPGIINEPAQKILPGQDLAPGRMPARVLFTLSNLANRPALLEGTPAQQEFQIRSKWPQDCTQSNLINNFAPSCPAHVHVSGGALLSCPLKTSHIAAGRRVPGRAMFCRARAPGTPAGHCFVAGRLDTVFCQIPKIARFDVGHFCPESSPGENPASSWIARTGCWAPGRVLDNFAPKLALYCR